MRIFRSLFFLFICLLTAALRASADLTLNTADFASLSEAVAAIPEGAGSVTVVLSAQPSTAEEPDLQIPNDRGITDLTLMLPDNSASLTLDEIIRICANGVPLTVGTGIDMPDTSIYGGACVSGEETELESSSLRIFGNVGFVFGGGYAEEGGLSAVREPSVTLEEGGLVYYEVFGGGHASGAGSRISSEKPSVLIRGITDYVLGAGYAEDGGTSECDATEVTVEENASIEVALFGGGSAAGAGSISTTGNPLVHLAGSAHWAFPGDFAFDSGVTRVEGSGRLEILRTGSAVDAFLGSFASDPGSSAFMNTAELMNCGSVELVLDRGQMTDGGTVQTLITANFPCGLP